MWKSEEGAAKAMGKGEAGAECEEKRRRLIYIQVR